MFYGESLSSWQLVISVALKCDRWWSENWKLCMSGMEITYPLKNKTKEQLCCDAQGWQQFHVVCETTFPITYPVNLLTFRFTKRSSVFVPKYRIKRRHVCVQERGNEFPNFLDPEPPRRGQLLSCSSSLLTLAATCSVMTPRVRDSQDYGPIRVQLPLLPLACESHSLETTFLLVKPIQSPHLSTFNGVLHCNHGSAFVYNEVTQ